MKKTIFYTFLVAVLLLTFSCSSSDDDTSSLNETGQKLIGKWYFDDPSIYGYTHNNSFTFTSDGKVVYRYWDGSPGNNYDSETGTFTTDGDKMTMKFPATVTLTFIQKVVFVTDKKVNFVATGNPNEEPYDGDYFKE